MLNMGDDFKKVLEKNYDIKIIEKILNRHKFPKSGNKDKLLEIILNNATIFEYFITRLLKESYQDQIKEICDELGIDSNSKVGELKKKILDKLNKNIKNKDIKNKIKFLDFGFYAYDFEPVLKRHKFPKSGNKDKLLEQIAGNDFLVETYMIKWKIGQNKDHIQGMCDILGIDSEGRKEKLLQKISDCVLKNETKKDIQNEVTITNTNSTKIVIKISEKDLENNFKRFSWEDAEDLTALLFNAKGYSAEVGVPSKDKWKRKRTGDHGIDVRAVIDKMVTGIQVKHWESNVQEDSVIKTNGSSQIFNRVIIISTKKGFDKNALDWAKQPGNAERMDLWDSDKFKNELRKHLINTS